MPVNYARDADDHRSDLLEGEPVCVEGVPDQLAHPLFRTGCRSEYRSRRSPDHGRLSPINRHRYGDLRPANVNGDLGDRRWGGPDALRVQRKYCSEFQTCHQIDVMWTRSSDGFAPVIRDTNSSPFVSLVRLRPTTRPCRRTQISSDSRMTWSKL